MTETNDKLGRGYFRSFTTPIANIESIWKVEQEVPELSSKETISKLVFHLEGALGQASPIQEVLVTDQPAPPARPIREIISSVDLARLLPPGEKLPKKYLAKKYPKESKEILKSIIEFINKTTKTTIRDAFALRFEEREVDPLPYLKSNSPLVDVFDVLMEEHLQVNKYFSLPVINNGENSEVNSIRRMWSYVDGLNLILRSSAPEIRSYLNEVKVKDIWVKNVVTVNKEDTLADVRFKFEGGLPFYPTHLPVKTSENGRVEGLIDYITVCRLLHKELNEYLADMPLAEIPTPFNPQDTVHPDDDIYKLIEKLVERKKRPITVMVGSHLTDNEFELEGIVNFFDVFKDFLTRFGQPPFDPSKYGLISPD